jgi:hypothetical protein
MSKQDAALSRGPSNHERVRRGGQASVPDMHNVEFGHPTQQASNDSAIEAVIDSQPGH